MSRLGHALRRRISGRELAVFFDPAYRLPLPSVEAKHGIELRRSERAFFWLVAEKVLTEADLHPPRKATWQELARVHTREWLEALQTAETLARVYSVDPAEVPVDAMLHGIRLSCGATIEAARHVLAHGGFAMNLRGGGHHAGPGRGGGFCAVNDMAVAVAAVRADGFAGKVAILDLDAHPPDGTAACFEGDPAVWIGSISGVSWKPLPGVDETVLPRHSDDAVYLKTLDALLGRMPASAIAFVLSGGDVLAGDRLGRLDLTLRGARERDLMVADKLAKVPTVWLPGGGYGEDAWRVLAGTGLAVVLGSREPIPAVDPLRMRFREIAAELQADRLGGTELTAEDIEEQLGIPRHEPPRLLGFYTTEGIEYALDQYGLLAQVGALGYGRFRVEIAREPVGDRLRVYGSAEGAEHLIVECVLEKREVAGAPVLYVHWLMLRNPRVKFDPHRPQLPGQDAPGLGLAREVGELLGMVAGRLGLAGVAFRPAWYHTAYAVRRDFRFVDARRQGRFEALCRDLASVPLLEATLAIAQGRVTLDGAPYAWEADEMVYWLAGSRRAEGPELAQERDARRFALRAA